MSSCKPGRPEYERRAVGWLRWRFLEGGHPVHYSGGIIGFEDVRFEKPGFEEGSVVVTFRAPDRPGGLFGRREDAVGPPEPLEDPDAASEQRAQMIWIRPEEDIHTGPGIPKKCEPAGVTWM